MIEEVLLFVRQNPDLQNVLNEYRAVSLVADPDIVFEKKSSLKKNQIFATSQVDELNYEEYLVNEAEGVLNEEQLSAIEEFISINPQFEKDRRLFALAHLRPENDIVFEAKESLKKKAIPVGTINAETYETFMARETEGDLNPDEKLQFAEFMQYNPHLEKDRKIYTLAKLSAESDIVFEEKNSLKHAIVIPFRRKVYYTLSAAASLALIFSIYFLLDQNKIPSNIVEQGKVKNTINAIINEPAQAIPDKQVAVKFDRPADVVSIHDRNTGKVTINAATTDIAVNNQAQEPLAYTDRSAVKLLQTISAGEVTSRSYVDPQFTFIRGSQMYSNQNLEFYYNLKLAQEIQYAQMNSKDQNPAKTIFNSITGKVGDLLALNRKAPPTEEKKNVSLWTFAELGVKTFNTITSSEVELNLQKDDEGKVVGYDLESSLIDIERELKK